MKQLTEDAQKRLDKYIEEVRLCLKGAKSVDPDEIQLDITEHIANELESAQEPVSCSDLESVLFRLGSPQQWVPEDELSWFRKIALRLRTGPDDWRLAYLTLGVFVISCISGPGVVLLLPLSFYFARTTLKIAGGIENLGNQKYLIIPPLACFHTLFSLLELAFPFCLLILAEEFEHSLRQQWRINDDLDYWIFAWFITLIVAGAWWLMISMVWRKRARKINFPFPESFTKKIPVVIGILGLLLFACGVVLNIYFGL